MFLLNFSFLVCLASEDLEYHAPMDLLSFDKIIQREYLSDNLPVLTVVLFVEDYNSFDSLTSNSLNKQTNLVEQVIQQFKLAQHELDFIDLVLVNLSLNNLGLLKSRYQLGQTNLLAREFKPVADLPIICLFKHQNLLPEKLAGFNNSAQIVKFIKKQLGRELRQLEQRYFKTSNLNLASLNLKAQQTKLNSNITYKSKISGYPHYYPQPYLGGLHAFGTPYRMDFFYPYYGPKFRL